MLSDHPGGAMVLMADASVHFLPETLDTNVGYCLASRNDKEPIPGDVLE
jgi:prepilin-type processing-associated H-X9-DG protein